KIRIPLLSAANWGGQGLHPRGNFEGFLHAASGQKWLEVPGDAHWSHFYTDYGRNLQKRFFDHFLKGIGNGWDAQPKVQRQILHPGQRLGEGYEASWPLPRPQWTKYYLHPDTMRLDPVPPAAAARLDYEALGDGLLFSTPPLKSPVEITGPLAAKLFLSFS